MNILLYILAAALAIFALRFFILRLKYAKLEKAYNSTKTLLEEKTLMGSTDEAKLAAILSSMVEGVLVVDKKGRIVLMNSSLKKDFLVNVDPKGKEPLEVIRNVDVGELVDEILKRADCGVITRLITLRLPQEKNFLVNSAPIVRDSGSEGAILVFHDITELRKLERIRQDFVANVSHELRTPLSSIKGYAETLLEGALEDKKHAKEFIEIIYRDSERLSNLIDDILDLSKIESGKMEMSFAAADIRAIIQRTLSVLEKQASGKNIVFKINLKPGLPKVNGDETRLIQVFMNLIDNAIKYTPESGSITISASVENGSVRVDIQDTGIGIPEKDLSRIFERFYRVDKARARDQGGTGLGLSIVKHIVSSHGGQVWVVSELQKGSTFSFTIPVYTP